MDAALRTLCLGLALVPYAALAGFDGWLHEKARRVPPTEQVLHAISALSLVGFVVLVFRASDAAAMAMLVVYGVSASLDEFGFHAHLDRRERRVHFASYAAMALFIAVWQIQSARA